MKLEVPRRYALYIIALVVIISAGVGLWWHKSRKPDWRKGYVYTSEGYGGYVKKFAIKKPKTADPLQPAINAYNTGKYADAEAEANRLIVSLANSENPTDRKNSVRARYVLAFAAARRKDMSLARDRFSVLQEEAAKLPDKGKQESQPGEVADATLEEEEHAFRPEV